MNTAKPSIQSSNGGAADDLIEELARLMAEGAQENSPDAPPPEKAKLTAANSLRSHPAKIRRLLKACNKRVIKQA